jgi:hypothetical protein
VDADDELDVEGPVAVWMLLLLHLMMLEVDIYPLHASHRCSPLRLIWPLLKAALSCLHHTAVQCVHELLM